MIVFRVAELFGQRERAQAATRRAAAAAGKREAQDSGADKLGGKVSQVSKQDCTAEARSLVKANSYLRSQLGANFYLHSQLAD